MTFVHSLEGNNSMLRAITFAALAAALTLSLAGPLPQAVAANRQAPAAQAGSNRLYLPGVIRYNNPSYISPFGVTMFDEVSDRTGLTAMATAGADWAMTNVKWVDLEPVEGQAYDFSAADARIQALASKGIRPLVLFDHNPPWAMTPPAGNLDPIRYTVRPDKLQRLVNVVQALVTRYNGQSGYPRVDLWAFYGEPDNFWAWGNDGAAYADMLAAVRPVVRAANSNAKIMIGAMAYEDVRVVVGGNTRGININFLPDMLRQLATKPGGIRGNLDYIGFNFFPISLTKWPTVREKTATVRQVMSQYGVGDMPIIMLEIGVWSGTTGGQPPYAVTETQQAQFLAKELVRGLSAGLTQMHVFQPLDVPNYFNWGLFRGTQNANDPKPAYTSYTVVARELGDSVYTGSISGGGLEGYAFSKEGATVTVFWGTSGNVTRDFGAACVRTVTRTNQPVQVNDNGAGDTNSVVGTIRITAVANEPVFVSMCAAP